jgi:hypothetical protein
MFRSQYKVCVCVSVCVCNLTPKYGAIAQAVSRWLVIAEAGVPSSTPGQCL